MSGIQGAEIVYVWFLEPPTHPPTWGWVGGSRLPPPPWALKTLAGVKRCQRFSLHRTSREKLSPPTVGSCPPTASLICLGIFSRGESLALDHPPPPRWSRSGRQWPKVRDFFEGMVMILLSNMSLSACSYEPPRGGFEWLSFQKKESRLTEFFLGSGKWPHPSRGGRLPLWYGWGQQVRGPSQWCSGGGGGLHGHF